MVANYLDTFRVFLLIAHRFDLIDLNKFNLFLCWLN